MATPSTKATAGAPPAGSARAARRIRQPVGAADAPARPIGNVERPAGVDALPGDAAEHPDRLQAALASTDRAPMRGEERTPTTDAQPEPLRQSEADSQPAGTLREATLADPAAEGGATAPVLAAAMPLPPRPRRKLVRDSFTMPQADFALIDLLKQRAIGMQRPAKKSELLRAGLQALAALDAEQLKRALDALEPLKPGRPKKLG